MIKILVKIWLMTAMLEFNGMHCVTCKVNLRLNNFRICTCKPDNFTYSVLCLWC